MGFSDRVGTNIRPDIVATKNGQSVIVEVKTPQGLARARAQLEALTDYAALHPNTSFRLVVTKPRKKHSKAA